MAKKPSDLIEDPIWQGSDAAVLLALSGDLSILISEDDVILDVCEPAEGSFSVDLRDNWVGKSVTDIVSKDSAEKVNRLLGSNAATATDATRWRHLNFMAADGVEVPLLTKHFAVETPGGVIRQIVCRDLRPMTELSSRWEKENRSLLQLVNEASTTEEKAQSASDLVGAAPLADIVAAAVDEVTRICIDEALNASDGNQAKAARILGITTTELRRRMGTLFH